MHMKNLKRYLVPITLFSLLSFPVFAQQQEELIPAYEGSTIAWNYPSDTPNHRGFRLSIDTISGNTQFAKDVRSTTLDNTVINGLPFGIYTMRLIATANSPALNSAPAVIKIDYQPRPVLPTPSNITIQLEWKVPTTSSQ
jgi:hypothetical protein